ncbi:hypothetical protein Q7P37_005479 [Cladosporium fusiforme]
MPSTRVVTCGWTTGGVSLGHVGGVGLNDAMDYSSLGQEAQSISAIVDGPSIHLLFSGLHFSILSEKRIGPFAVSQNGEIHPARAVAANKQHSPGWPRGGSRHVQSHRRQADQLVSSLRAGGANREVDIALGRREPANVFFQWFCDSPHPPRSARGFRP